MSEAKLTIHDTATTPSQQLTAEALKSAEIKDARGRVIRLTRPGVLAQFNLVRMLGDVASNQAYVQMCLPLLFVSGIDGNAVMMPNSERELHALIQRLDDEGVTAVALGVREHWGAPDPEAAKADVKK